MDTVRFKRTKYRHYSLSTCFIWLIAILVFAACTSDNPKTPEVDIDATVNARVAATQEAQANLAVPSPSPDSQITTSPTVQIADPQPEATDVPPLESSQAVPNLSEAIIGIWTFNGDGRYFTIEFIPGGRGIYAIYEPSGGGAFTGVAMAQYRLIGNNVELDVLDMDISLHLQVIEVTNDSLTFQGVLPPSQSDMAAAIACGLDSQLCPEGAAESTPLSQSIFTLTRKDVTDVVDWPERILGSWSSQDGEIEFFADGRLVVDNDQIGRYEIISRSTISIIFDDDEELLVVVDVSDDEIILHSFNPPYEVEAAFLRLTRMES